MKIDGFNPFSTGNTLPVETLSLRDGQKIIGKVISASADEALLEMAGHSFHAKIEGNPDLESGTVLKFLVNHDQQGRVLLRIISNNQPANIPNDLDTLGKQAIAQKAIITALTKEGLPVNQENIQNFVQLLQSFESKYQQILPPQVLALIIAHKWQVNPETIITSWIYQDAEIRDLLWNLLRQSDSEHSGTNILARLLLGMSAKPEEVPAKFETLLKQIETIIRYLNKNESESSVPSKENQGLAKGLFRQPLLTDNPELSQLLRQPGTKSMPETQLRQFAKPNQNPNPSVEVSNNQTPSQAADKLGAKAPFVNEFKQLVSKLASTFESKDLSEKIEVLLDRNLALNKAILHEDGINGNYNLIPFLLNDSHDTLHEVLVKWREESGDGKQSKGEQILQMNIPTENLGEIHLYLRTGEKGSQITFKVENDSVRKYLLRNLIELKESVNRKDVLINVALEPKENYSDPLSGVDLWI
ncbi:MAG: flagellar hook-length control protein FliK [Bacteroidota bacterium]